MWWRWACLIKVNILNAVYKSTQHGTSGRSRRFYTDFYSSLSTGLRYFNQPAWHSQWNLVGVCFVLSGCTRPYLRRANNLHILPTWSNRQPMPLYLPCKVKSPNPSSDSGWGRLSVVNSSSQIFGLISKQMTRAVTDADCVQIRIHLCCILTTHLMATLT